MTRNGNPRWHTKAAKKGEFAFAWPDEKAAHIALFDRLPQPDKGTAGHVRSVWMALSVKTCALAPDDRDNIEQSFLASIAKGVMKHVGLCQWCQNHDHEWGWLLYADPEKTLVPPILAARPTLRTTLMSTITTTPAPVESQFETTPALKALDRLCRTAREDGGHLDPIWVVGPLASHFVGRTSAERFQEPESDRQPHNPWRNTAESLRRLDGTLYAVARHLCGLGSDEPMNAYSAGERSRVSPLLRHDFRGMHVALPQPVTERWATEVEHAAYHFEPMRDLRILEPRAACLNKISLGIAPDHRIDALEDYEAVMSTLVGPQRWNVRNGWDSGALPMSQRFMFQNNYTAERAETILRYPAALRLTIAAYAATAKEPTNG